MSKRQRMLELRERLDNTLAMPDLVNEDSVRSLVKDQLIRSSFNGNEVNIDKVAEKRATEVSNFLGMLRSASGKDQKAIKALESSSNEWKLKQDTDELRVMYREGLNGSPFHTLLADGFADGPIDVCLCVSWESNLYRKWWPQYNFPTFKITESTCLRNICVGEDISLVRVKAPWPVSGREALIHYFEIEYFKEDLIIVLLNSISDPDQLDVSTHGYNGDGIPKAENIIRIDLIGGFVLQKVDSTRSFFRVIANMDIKLDFIPPSLINFISRQLIGNGHKIYQKVVGSVATTDDDYRRALERPMYVRIREGLTSRNKQEAELSDAEEKEKPSALLREEHVESAPEITETPPVGEIVEEEADQNKQIGSSFSSSGYMSHEVESAMKTLDQAIAFVRGFYGNSPSNGLHIDQNLPFSEPVEETTGTENEDFGSVQSMESARISIEEFRSVQSAESARISAEVSRNNDRELVGSEANDGRQEFTETEDKTIYSHEESKAVNIASRQVSVSECTRKVCDEESLNANGVPTIVTKSDSNLDKGSKKKKKLWLCCY